MVVGLSVEKSTNTWYVVNFHMRTKPIRGTVEPPNLLKKLINSMNPDSA